MDDLERLRRIEVSMTEQIRLAAGQGKNVEAVEVRLGLLHHIRHDIMREVRFLLQEYADVGIFED